MSLAVAIYEAIKGFGDKVYPVIAPQEETPPWVTYRIDQSSDEDQLTYQIGGDLNPYWATFYVAVWTLSFPESNAKVEPYVQALVNYTSPNLQKIEYFGRVDLADPDLGLFGIQMKFKGYTVEV